MGTEAFIHSISAKAELDQKASNSSSLLLVQDLSLESLVQNLLFRDGRWEEGC